MSWFQLDRAYFFISQQENNIDNTLSFGHCLAVLTLSQGLIHLVPQALPLSRGTRSCERAQPGQLTRNGPRQRKKLFPQKQHKAIIQNNHLSRSSSPSLLHFTPWQMLGSIQNIAFCQNHFLLVCLFVFKLTYTLLKRGEKIVMKMFSELQLLQFWDFFMYKLNVPSLCTVKSRIPRREFQIDHHQVLENVH